MQVPVPMSPTAFLAAANEELKTRIGNISFEKRDLAPGSLASTATQCRVSPPDAGDVGGVPVFHLSRSRPY